MKKIRHTLLLAAPTTCKYCGIYRVGDAQVGHWSVEAGVTLGGEKPNALTLLRPENQYHRIVGGIRSLFNSGKSTSKVP